MRKAVLVVAAASSALVWLGSPREARAYRPFDGTDAEIAEAGEFELELGPVHYLRSDSHSLILPATVLNLGLVHRLELVIDFKNFVSLDSVPGQAPVRLLDTDVFLKYILREGALQGKTGLSVAVEAGPLTPNINGQNSFGASANLIVSHRWSSGTIHFDNQVQLTRAQNLDLFSGVILEGPKSLPVRPVAEVFIEHDFGAEGNPTTAVAETKYSALLGAIWEVSHEFQVDFGLRAAREGEVGVEEVRLGFTWTVPIWKVKEEEPATKAASGAWALRRPAL